MCCTCVCAVRVCVHACIVCVMADRPDSDADKDLEALILPDGLGRLVDGGHDVTEGRDGAPNLRRYVVVLSVYHCLL